MKKSFKIIIIIVSILLLLLGIAYWLFVKSVGDVEVPSTLNEDIVEFPELNEKVYIRARAWGLAGNHEEIIISTAPIEKDRQAVKGGDYIFYTTEIYYQKKRD
jgi:flagellar basal body-associated protein FliL